MLPPDVVEVRLVDEEPVCVATLLEELLIDELVKPAANRLVRSLAESDAVSVERVRDVLAAELTVASASDVEEVGDALSLFKGARPTEVSRLSAGEEAFAERRRRV